MSFSRVVLRAGRSCSAMPTRAFSVKSVARNAAEPTYKAPALGVNKTFDEALKVIAEDKAKRLADIKSMEATLAQLTKAAPSAAKDTEIAALKEKIFKQEAFAEINEPEIQWQFKNGKVDMSKAVFRYMKGKQFQRETLPVIQQRTTQMFVTPDLLPAFTPSVNVQLDFGAGSIPEETKIADGYFETGSYLLPGKTINEPKVNVTSFHDEQRYYTVALVDPDMPDVENETYKQQLHWLITNVPLSATQTELVKDNADVVLSYLPPHPPKGTKYHRYTLLLAEQPNAGQDKIQMDASQISRETTLSDLCSHFKLNVKGLTFFRQVWDKDVSRIFKDILQQDEPVYGNQPKVDELLDETGQKKKKFIHM
ncbi:MAG: phosphatidylethanolamine-binding protein [Linnemannia gamsii]|nr:MAG: phosphatidylethanolamine-binding protein [Linnemannia gamsii]